MSKFDLDLLNDVLVHGTCFVGPDGKRIPPEEWYVKSVDPAASKIDLTQFEGHTPNVRVTKCPCGHRACTSWHLSTQGSSGFEEADARLYGAAPDLLAAYKAAFARIDALEAENKELRDGLHHISLCSQNSMSSKEECGRMARALLAKDKANG